MLLQLGIPGLRLERTLRTFRQTFERNGCNLAAWRKSAHLTKKDSQWLDANDGAGGQPGSCAHCSVLKHRLRKGRHACYGCHARRLAWQTVDACATHVPLLAVERGEWKHHDWPTAT